ncbi:MAG: aminodeoxychorismate/anthranilate synthase component II [Gammaproteobacteria bacterium]|nr:aminodeoxychorismate/anthranilate synthase component II [Gammaproteobacteria bacterium]
MILLIDNYDSFVYNLARYIRELGFETLVKRNDEINLAEINDLNPSHIILSPGPCMPNKAGICLELVKTYASSIPILGVCLGHQAIAQAFGASIIKAKAPRHGKTSLIQHNGKGIFAGVENPFQAARYHSLIVDKNSLPNEFEITAQTQTKEIMAIRHSDYPLVGVQFHPESVLTKHGYDLLKNFVKDELEDQYIAIQRLEQPHKYYSLDEVEKEFGLGD